MRNCALIDLLSRAVACCFAAVAAAQPQQIALQPVASGFSQPLFVTAIPGDFSRIFVLEKAPLVSGVRTGRVRQINLETFEVQPAATPFLSVGVSHISEQGLLGLAFHPNYLTGSPYLWVYYTRPDGDSVISRFRALGGDPAAASVDTASEQVLMVIDQPAVNHNGGWMGFGPEGNLYIAVGDGGGGNDDQPPFGATTGNAQNLETLLGKILRIDVDGQDNIAGNEDDGTPDDVNRPFHRIPQGNPFAGGTPGLDEILHFGLRNAWRCSFDRVTGELWVADVGQDAREEITVIPPGSVGLNLGWRCFEGTFATGLGGCDPAPAPHFAPLLEYGHETTPPGSPLPLLGCSITGGYVYRGDAMPGLLGTYFFADLCASEIWTVEKCGVQVSAVTNRTAELTPDAPQTLDTITSFGEDAAGEIYICDFGGGEIYRIVPDGPLTPAPTDCNGNGVLDACDIATGASQDQNLNGVPDECDPCGQCRHDFSGDGRADLLRRNIATGVNTLWTLDGSPGDGSFLLNVVTLPQVADTNWAMAAKIDINGDRKGDILWRNRASGSTVVWEMNGSAYVRPIFLPNADPSWRIVAADDFDGDGDDDIYWHRDASGENAVWTLQNGAYMNLTALPATGDRNWTLTAVADMNADGKPDLLWRNAFTGSTAVWFMNGAAVASTGNISPAQSDVNWRLVDAADFSSDGKPDLMWRHALTGAKEVWVMDGVNRTAVHALPTIADTNWRVLEEEDVVLDASRDFNGDRYDETVWFNSVTEQAAVWLNGANQQPTAFVSLPVAPAPGFVLVACGDLNRDNRPDLLWENPATGEKRIVLVRGATEVGQFALPTTVPTLRVRGIADADADRINDVWLHDETTGQFLIWKLSGRPFDVGPVVSTFVGPSVTGWRMALVADFDGDRRADVQWRSLTTGDRVLWYMNGGALRYHRFMEGVADLNWREEKATDINGDLRLDIVWRNQSTGANSGWVLGAGPDGILFQSWQPIPGVVNTAWRMVD